MEVEEWVDPRIQRTRQMLHEAFERLLELESFEKISVGEIAAEAKVNRATFYTHYADKYALIEGLASTRFQELLKARGVVFDGHCPTAIMGITLAMCDYLAGLPGANCPNRRQIEKHFESALIAVARGMILRGFDRVPPAGGHSPELVAATMGGAIFGAANEWARTADRCPPEEAVKAIFALVSPMLTGLRRVRMG